MYDDETGLYYLQSRYYDPALCRFLNADGLASTGQGILGANMFAYCGNGPVGVSDPKGQWVIGTAGASFNGGAGAGGSTGTVLLFDGDGNCAVIVTGFYGGSTPNIGVSVDVLLWSSADNIFEYIMGQSISFGGSAALFSFDGHAGIDSNGKQFGGVNFSVGLSALPTDLKGGIGYAYLEEILFCQGMLVPDHVTMDFFSSLPSEYQNILHDQLGIPFAAPVKCMAGGCGVPWRAMEQ